MKRVCLAALVALLLGWAGEGWGQGLPGVSITLQAAPEVGIPLGSFADRDQGVGAGTGVGVEVGGVLGLGSLLGVYGDYQYLRFACEVCEQVELDSGLVDAGFEAGAQLSPPLPVFGLQPWLRAGVVGHQLQFSRGDGSKTSDLGFGFGVGAGVHLPLGGSLAISPALRFRSYSGDVHFASLPDRTVDVSYMAAGVALTLRF